LIHQKAANATNTTPAPIAARNVMNSVVMGGAIPPNLARGPVGSFTGEDALR
jgi:hypothetical protein